MGSIFGKQKKSRTRVTEQDKAVLQLKQQRDKLRQYQRKIIVNLEKERELAKKLLQENKKDKAKLILRKKKYQEQVLQRTDQQLENMEKMVHDIEFAVIEVQVVEGLKAGNLALKKIHEVISVEDVERILDETQEAVEKQREIDAVLSGALTMEDEEDVMEELNEIIKESLPQVPEGDAEEKGISEEEDNVELPEVPTDAIGAKEKKIKRPRKELLVAS